MQNSVGQYRTQTDPSQSGVHIQIYNPSVGAPGAAPVYNVNAPSYGTNPMGVNGCYPSNYYTNQWGCPCCNPQYPNSVQGAGGQIPYAPNAPQGVNGQVPYAPNAPQGVNGQVPYAPNAPQGVNGQVPYAPNAPQANPQGSTASQQNTYNQQGQTVNGTQVNGNQTITVNNPQQSTQPPVATQTSNNDGSTSSSDSSDKKTEKRTIVMLTDDYIKNVENYLNSQDKEVRLMGAKEVAARAMEDPSRKDDKALNALVNKMIQDPDMKVRFLGLSLLYSRAITGDDYTVGVLKNMQNSSSGYGHDALMAANILLKMSGQTTEKEFEVTEKDKKKKKTEDINKVMTLL